MGMDLLSAQVSMACVIDGWMDFSRKIARLLSAALMVWAVAVLSLHASSLKVVSRCQCS